MRGILSVLALLGLHTPAWAGLYNMGERHDNIPSQNVRAVIAQLRAVAVEPKGPLDPASQRALYLRRVAELEKFKDEGTLDTLDRVNLSACYIRLGRIGKAISLLKAGDPKHFMIQANLATAYEMAGNLDLALRCQEQVLLLWPHLFAGWKQEHLDFYKECERAYLLLLSHRSDEMRRGGTPRPADIDPIFPRFKLVGSGKGGAYEPGRLSSEEMQKLPAKAYGITLQLVLWRPQDPRTYWLLAELLNANGNVDIAYDIMRELIDSVGNGVFRELFEHRRILQGPAIPARTLRRPSKQGHLLSELMVLPRPMLVPGVAGAAAYQASCGVAEAMGWAYENPKIDTLDPPDNPAPVAQQLPFNWRHVTVGFGFGFLVAALLGFQLREWQRRRARQLQTEGTGEQDSALSAPRESSAAFEQHSTSVQPPGS